MGNIVSGAAVCESRAELSATGAGLPQMKLNALALAPVLALLVACADPAEPPPDPDAAEQVGEAERLPRTLPPPTEERPRYVGLWAASAEGCAEPAWRFRADGVSTMGEVSCSFDTVTIVPTGYQIASTCHAEGDVTRNTIELSFAESARAMMVSGGPWASPIGLTYCGEEATR